MEGGKWSIDYHKLNAKLLDEVSPDNPVFLHDWTNHLAWFNSAALKAARAAACALLPATTYAGALYFPDMHGEAICDRLPVFTVKSGQVEFWESYLKNVFQRCG